MYQLTLTHSERMAIDFVGYRYSHGNDLFDLLGESVWHNDRIHWNDKWDITFNIPEHLAWQVCENAVNEDGNWALFSSDLAYKMQQFCDEVI